MSRAVSMTIKFQLGEWSTVAGFSLSESDLDPCDDRVSRLHRVRTIRSWVIFDRVVGQVNLYVSDPDKNGLYSAVVHRVILQR